MGGIAEMAGCLLAMVGSYAGSALVTFGIQAPFLLCSCFSVTSTLLLALSLGRRRSEIASYAPCVTTLVDTNRDDIAVGLHSKAGTGEALQRSWSGLRQILQRSDSYITMEVS